MDSPIARNLISSLAFKSLTSGAFNFFRAGILFRTLRVYSAVCDHCSHIDVGETIPDR
jgi:hypothetical protein